MDHSYDPAQILIASLVAVFLFGYKGKRRRCEDQIDLTFDGFGTFAFNKFFD